MGVHPILHAGLNRQFSFACSVYISDLYKTFRETYGKPNRMKFVYK